MDSVLLDYLRSGVAWLFVGSGPSIEAGYPSWNSLAGFALALQATEGRPSDKSRQAFNSRDYPLVFQLVSDDVGLPRLLQHLRGALVSHGRSRTYETLARWPVPVYLTTNYDDEISTHLVKLGLGYQTYGNSEDHLDLLIPSLTNAIFKLHGDLRSMDGLVLTASQYERLSTDDEFDYWRTKLTSVFQMHPIVLVGYSLSDAHIQVVLEAAKRGASVTQPVCWLAPNVEVKEAREYLAKYRIRVISYPTGADDHRGLKTLISDISRFVPPRETVHISSQIASVLVDGSRVEPASAAIFVFNRLAPFVDPLDLRIAVGAAAVEAFVAGGSTGAFTIEEALASTGWPVKPAATPEFLGLVADSLLAAGTITAAGTRYGPGPAAGKARAQRAAFNHLRDRFLDSVRLRLKRECSEVDDKVLDSVALAVNQALTGYFRRGGLTLATLLFASEHSAPTVPMSITGFINEASAQYPSLALRRAFSHVSVDLFVDSNSAEREYLGRLAHGFFAFHALGAHGEAAVERLRRARETVWLIDSNSLIPLLALAAPSNAAFVDAFRRLKAGGIRCFTTGRLFDEAVYHLGYATKVLERLGSDSPYVIAAASGETPYRRQNQFIQGFIRWREAGNPSDWDSYLHAIFGTRTPGPREIQARLNSLGVEKVEFSSWPGFVSEDFADQEEAVGRLRTLMTEGRQGGTVDHDFERWLENKLPPEAEALVVVRHERDGRYRILSDDNRPSPSFFISSTALINAVLDGASRITWQPEAFLGFVASLMTESGGASSDRAFEVLVWTIARSGVNPIPEQTIERVFGGVIDETTILAAEERQVYDEVLAEKYGESSERVLARIPPSRRAIAALQLNNEMVQAQEHRVAEARERAAQAQVRANEAAQRAKSAEGQLDAVAKYRAKMQKREATVASNRRKKAAHKGKRN